MYVYKIGNVLLARQEDKGYVGFDGTEYKLPEGAAVPATYDDLNEGTVVLNNGLWVKKGGKWVKRGPVSTVPFDRSLPVKLASVASYGDDDVVLSPRGMLRYIVGKKPAVGTTFGELLTGETFVCGNDLWRKSSSGEAFNLFRESYRTIAAHERVQKTVMSDTIAGDEIEFFVNRRGTVCEGGLVAEERVPVVETVKLPDSAVVRITKLAPRPERGTELVNYGIYKLVNTELVYFRGAFYDRKTGAKRLPTGGERYTGVALDPLSDVPPEGTLVLRDCGTVYRMDRNGKAVDLVTGNPRTCFYPSFYRALTTPKKPNVPNPFPLFGHMYLVNGKEYVYAGGKLHRAGEPPIPYDNCTDLNKRLQPTDSPPVGSETVTEKGLRWVVVAEGRANQRYPESTHDVRIDCPNIVLPRTDACVRVGDTIKICDKRFVVSDRTSTQKPLKLYDIEAQCYTKYSGQPYEVLR